MKATIIFLLLLFTSILTFGQKTEVRYYNGQHTKETALLKVNEYLKLNEKNGFFFKKTGEKSPYQFSGIWTSSDGTNTKVDVLIGNQSTEVKLLVCTKNGMNLIEIAQNEEHSLHRVVSAAYDLLAFTYTNLLFDHMGIAENKTPTQPTVNTASGNMNEQTTETRYFNGQYTKETALLKLNTFMKLLNSKGFIFNEAERQSAYQFSGTWAFIGINSTVAYFVGDKSITVKLIKYTNDGMNISEILKDEKHRLHNTAKKMYAMIVQSHITAFFDYMRIANNSNPSQPTTTMAIVNSNVAPTQTNTATSKGNTVWQTTETRYYNGQHTKETALQKVNWVINRLSSKERIFNRIEGQSVYQFSGTWSLRDGTSTLEYSIGEKSITVKLVKYTNDKMNISEIQQNEKHHLHEIAKTMYDLEVQDYITVLFMYMLIDKNISQITPIPAKATADKKYNRPFVPVDISNKLLSTEVKTFFNSYNNNPNNVAEYVTDIGIALDKQNYKGQALYPKFSEILKEVYSVDKYAAFRMMMIVDRKTLDETLKLIPNDIRNYLREEANIKIQKEKEMK